MSFLLREISTAVVLGHGELMMLLASISYALFGVLTKHKSIGYVYNKSDTIRLNTLIFISMRLSI
ncbi:hypothetical protein EIL81_16410 [Photorhabdus laumondii subsp. laumondii]|nr:hypothetical protein PluDJC_16240 [Photorhabdus laumondii subsp. laumondii]AXG48190.1 hypothetical protein PluTT01m_16355 [Photorhabdus laumondii subsp. laumondii]MCZ1250408.1 hypothetical protein [Photorhabdus laumondii subsp. laumondii]PQQ37089.1 hypothetical protein C6H68_15350 [Photorhabdus luminescens]